MTKSLIAVISAVLVSSSVSLCAQDFNASWSRKATDASRTGVKASNATNVKETMGEVKGKTFYAPNGKIFKGGRTAKAAKLMIDAQPAMASAKTLVAHSAKEMVRHSPECELSNWIVDYFMVAVEEMTGKHVDIGITNFGGIRVDMPKGDVFEDDIKSMFPFKNTLCYVSLKGSTVRHILEQMAASSFQALGGVRVVAKDRQLVEATIGGEPIDDEKVYGLATINFLLDGGDRLHLGDGALEMIDTGKYVIDVMLPYVKSYEAQGKLIDYETDGRVVVIRTDRQ